MTRHAGRHIVGGFRSRSSGCLPIFWAGRGSTTSDDGRLSVAGWAVAASARIITARAACRRRTTVPRAASERNVTAKTRAKRTHGRPRGNDAIDRAPRGREPSVREGLTRIIVDWSGSGRRHGRVTGRSEPCDKGGLGLLSDPMGRNKVKPEQASKVLMRMPTLRSFGEGGTCGEAIDTRTHGTARFRLLSFRHCSVHQERKAN